MAGKNVKKGGRLPGFFDDYGVGEKGGGIVLDSPTVIPKQYTTKTTGGSKAKAAPKKTGGRKK